MRNLLLLLLFAISIAFSTRLTGAEEPAAPNVLLIAVDDLNDWIGCLGGHPDARTPNIDRLAARGTLFTNAHCQGPICGPSRASLLTGLYPHTTGVYAQPGKKLGEDREFFRGKLLPEYFASHGYKTYGCGKITHGYPMELAFEHLLPWKGGFGPKPAKGKRFNYHLPDVRWTGTQTDWGAFPDSDGGMPDFQSATWAVDQLAEMNTEKPFFLAVGMVRPHVPFYVPEKWFEPFPLEEISLPAIKDDDLADVPVSGRRMHEMPKYPDLDFLRANDDKQLRLCVQAYLACISFMDAQVGRVLDALDASPHADNTVIILFSDHGYHLGEKDRVSKHSLWEESTKVPLIVVRPGERKAAAKCDQPVGLIDIFPTLTDLCRIPANGSNEGKSLAPLLGGTESDGWRHSILTTYARQNHALRSRTHRYIRYEDGSEELYDHRSDPNEWTNLASKEESEALLNEFRAHLPKDDVPYHPACSPAPVNLWFEEHFKRHGLTK